MPLGAAGDQIADDAKHSVSTHDSVNDKPAAFERYEVYPWELKNDPAFAIAWKHATRPAIVPSWVKRIDMAATKGRSFRTEDGWAILYSGNQVHRGGRSEMTFVYLPSERLVCGALHVDDNTTRFGSRDACKRPFAKPLQPSN